MRNIRVAKILVDNAVCDVTFSAVGIDGRPTSCGEEVKNDSILSTWEGRKYLLSVDLSYCRGITDNGLLAIGHECGQLQTIDLRCCEGIRDIGVSALGHGCGQMQSINLTYCEGVTDVVVSALGDGCGQL
jgi:F-box and leucine-rich repeat protein 2/20